MSNIEFMKFMLEQYNIKRFTEQQIAKALKKHNVEPTTHLLIQLASVGIEENVFTEEEKEWLLPTQ